MSIDADFLTPRGAWSSPLFGELIDMSITLRMLMPGDHVGPYRVVDELGRGGMSIVYRAARADGAYEQQVALKLLRPEIDPLKAHELLQRERQILANLDHPGIVRLLDGGATDDGLLWFAMEHIEGERIDRYCIKQRLTLEARLRLFLEVCEAVQHAHSRLLIHRDIKPGNILVGADGRPRLLDFGIAGILDAGIGSTRGMTPGVASPEQQRGETETTATDIYQLGVLLRVLMQVDARADAPTAAVSPPTYSMTSPSSTAPVRAMDALPLPRRGRNLDLTCIVEKASAKLSEQRYATVASLGDEVRAWLAGLPVAARAGGISYRLRRFVGRHRIALASTLAAVLLLVSMSGVFVWNLNASRQAAEDASIVAASESDKSRDITQFMVETLSFSSPINRTGRKATIDELLASAADRITTEFVDHADVRAELMNVIGHIYVTREDYVRALPLLRESVELGKADTSLSPTRLAKRELGLSTALTSDADRDAQLALLKSADQRFAESAPNDPDRVQVLHLLAMRAAEDGDYAAAVAHETAAVALDEANPQVRSTALVSHLSALAQLRLRTGDRDGVLEMARRACELGRSQLGPDAPHTFVACSAYANVSTSLGRYDLAEREYSQLRRVAVVNWGEGSTKVVLNDANYSTLLRKQKRWSEAEQYLRAALARSQALPKENDYASIDTWDNLGDLYYDQHRYWDALAAWQHMLEMVRAGRHASTGDVGQRSLKIAKALIALKRCDEAAPYLAETRALTKRFPKTGKEVEQELTQLDQRCMLNPVRKR